MITWILAACSVYVLVALLVFALQKQMVYPSGSRHISATPDTVGLEFQEFMLDVEAGVKVHGWLVPPPERSGEEDGQPAAPALWVHFSHGNAGNISQRLETLLILHNLGLGVAIYDYRGYGQSTGEPDVEGTFRDAAAVWRLLTETVPPERVICWGRSLGGAIAAQLAVSQSEKGAPPAALILESTFTSIVAMGKRSYPFLPISLLCRYPYNTLALVDKVTAPVLLIHSRGDDIVPWHMGEQLYEKSPEPREFLEISGDHNRGFLDSGERYTQGVREFLRRQVLGAG